MIRIGHHSINVIKEHCVQIRTAIITVKEKSNLFEDFPNGCCRDASIVSGMYLKEKGFLNIFYCHKEFDRLSPSHAWLEYEGLIIDLTLNQFHKGFPEVLIAPIHEGIKFHRNSFKEPLDPSITGCDIGQLFSDYNLIKNEL